MDSAFVQRHPKGTTKTKADKLTNNLEQIYKHPEHPTKFNVIFLQNFIKSTAALITPKTLTFVINQCANDPMTIDPMTNDPLTQ